VRRLLQIVQRVPRVRWRIKLPFHWKWEKQLNLFVQSAEIISRSKVYLKKFTSICQRQSVCQNPKQSVVSATVWETAVCWNCLRKPGDNFDACRRLPRRKPADAISNHKLLASIPLMIAIVIGNRWFQEILGESYKEPIDSVLFVPTKWWLDHFGLYLF